MKPDNDNIEEYAGVFGENMSKVDYEKLCKKSDERLESQARIFNNLQKFADFMKNGDIKEIS